MQIYNEILQEKTESEAIDFLHGAVFSEMETTEDNSNNCNDHFIDQHMGVSCYYNNTADYYYYVDDES